MNDLFESRLKTMNLDETEERKLRSYFHKFQQKVQVGSDDECWEWTGGKNDERYGYMRVGIKSEKAHRLSYQWLIGPIPKGKILMHTCDNPSCVNPYHLRVGTQLDNVRDMMEKGRNVTRTQKLNKEQVLEIRHRYACGETQQALADEYGVGVTAISKIVNRKTWKHIAYQRRHLHTAARIERMRYVSI